MVDEVFEIGEKVINNSTRWFSGTYKNHPNCGTKSDCIDSIGFKGEVIDIGYSTATETVIYLIKWDYSRGMCSKSGEQLKPDKKND